MSLALVRSACSLALLAAYAAPSVAQTWKTQYFYDRAGETLAFQDLKFATAKNGVAVGVVLSQINKDMARKTKRRVALVTTDGGATWTETPLNDNPYSIFFLKNGRGWLVTDGGIWITQENGKDWTKLPRSKFNIQRVYFIDENRGWGVGPERTAVETNDGGKTWKPITETPAAPASHFGKFDSILFLTPVDGVILGWTWQPGLSQDALRPKEIAGYFNAVMMLETHDGGKTWRGGSITMAGAISRVSFAGPGDGLGLVEGLSRSAAPTAVFRLAWPTGGGKLEFQDKTIYVTDVLAGAGGVNYIAGMAGGATVAAPRRVKAFKSTAAGQWTPVPVDYRAVAGRVILAGADGSAWMATDTGMILKLVN